jgi:ribonuclease P protein component
MGLVAGSRTGRFRRVERLKGREDIQGTFARGRKFSCPGAKLFIRDNGKETNRIAFTFARKYGNAVQRNRSRRLSREAYRLVKSRLRQGYDLVLLVYPDGDRYDHRVRQLDALLSKAGLFAE